MTRRGFKLKKQSSVEAPTIAVESSSPVQTEEVSNASPVDQPEPVECVEHVEDLESVDSVEDKVDTEEEEPSRTDEEPSVVERNKLDFIKPYRARSLRDIYQDIDIDIDTKLEITNIFIELQWIEDHAYSIFVACKNNLWNIATTLLEHSPRRDHWRTLRMLIGNWASFRNRGQLKAFCKTVMEHDSKAVVQLNAWSKEQGKKFNLTVKGYCDFCKHENKQFIMMYSEL